MIVKVSFKQLYAAASILFFTLYGVFAYIMLSGRRTNLLELLFPVLFLVICLLFIVLLRKKLVAYFDHLEHCMNQMIAGDLEVEFVCEEDSMLSKTEYKLKRVYDIVNSMTAHSQREKEMIQGIVTDLSHQVKTPIASARMAKDIVQSREMSDEQRRLFIEQIGASVDKLDFLMESLVKMSRLETGVLVMKKKAVCLYDTLAQALSGISQKAEDKHIQVQIDCDSQFELQHDTRWTAEALLNILDNAVKYTPEGGHIFVEATMGEVYVCLKIRDTGIGIPEQSHGAIFNRFYREPSVHDVDGMGIGLYLTREIIHAQRGYIKVQSKEGEGTTFHVYLPL